MGTTQSDTSVACTLERLLSIWFENNSFSNSLYFEKKNQTIPVFYKSNSSFVKTNIKFA